MSQRIDAELERIAQLGQKPKVIYVGDDLHQELYDELNPPIAADLVRDGQKAYVISTKDVTDYKGIRVIVLQDVAPDYLRIETY
jgi:hypothetical protein